MRNTVNYKILFPSENATEQFRDIIEDYSASHANGQINVSDEWIKTQIDAFNNANCNTVSISLKTHSPMYQTQKNTLGFPNSAPKPSMAFANQIGAGILSLSFSSKNVDGAKVVESVKREQALYAGQIVSALTQVKDQKTALSAPSIDEEPEHLLHATL